MLPAILSENLCSLLENEERIKEELEQIKEQKEKKKNEILQMLTLEPNLVILDETDSGLDIDALRVIANGVNKFRNKNRSFIIITHYQRLLDYIKPDFIHVLIDGKIVKSGGKEIANELESRGYNWIKQ